jgi:solute carrier family 25 phosphate transporter 23/24/25/41
VHGVLCLYRQGGVPALFLGNSANVIKSVPELGVKFLAFDRISAMQQQRRQAQDPRSGSSSGGSGGSGSSMSERLLSGALAGAASCVAIYPLEVAKTRMTLGHTAYRGLGETLAAIIRTEGPVALTQGLGASLAGIVPFCAIDLALYSASKDYVQRRSGGAEPGSGALLLCGAFSSVCSTVATYPLALIRTLLQAGGSEGFVRYTGVVDCARQTVAQGGGPLALFRGLGPNLLKAVPSISISYVVFENVKRLLAPASD